MKHLTKAEFLSTFGVPMQRVSIDAEAPCDFWSYFDQIPTDDFEGHDCTAASVSYAWNDPSGRFQHVLVDSENKNIFMVLVIDLTHHTVFGHCLLNLNREYGIESPGAISN